MITDEEYDELMKLFFSPDNTPKEQPKKNEEYKIYVAYGSNINTEQMMFRCPDAEIYATGMVQDYELSFNKVATLQKKKGEEAPALLWKLSSSAVLLVFIICKESACPPLYAHFIRIYFISPVRNCEKIAKRHVDFSTVYCLLWKKKIIFIKTATLPFKIRLIL